MPTEDEAQLPLRNRFIAAAGAAVVAAVVVNPLDVIKTRIQAQAMAQASGRATAAAAAGGDPARLVHTLYERWGICETPLCVRRTPAGLTCSNAAAAAAATAMPGGSGGGVAAAAGSAGRTAVNGSAAGIGGAAAGVVDESILRALRSIARTEGLSTMWRGTGASLAVSVPMVGIYMPLYDHLLRTWAPYTGAAAAPIVAGSAARTLAVFAVAPFELLRTRLQAIPHGPSGANPLQLLSGGAEGRRGSALAATLRGLPVMWTGLSATLLRDVPFSALYWALVEPIRAWLLPPDGRLRLPGSSSAAEMASAAAGADGSSSSSSSRTDGGAGGAWRSTVVPVPVCTAAAEGPSLPNAAASTHTAITNPPPAAPGPAAAREQGACAAAPRPVPHHSPSHILAANMLSGFAAGGLAAAATTPFDVVKTRMQIAAAPPPAVGCGACGPAAAATAAVAGASLPPRRGVWGVMRDVYAAEGFPGLFAGVKPRAYRAAPACAIVISCYELLKRELTPE